VLRDPLELQGSPGYLVALHAVPAEGQEEVSFLRVDLGEHGLAAEHTAEGPEHAGELLGQGAVVVARAQAPQQAYTEGRLEMASLAAAAHVGEGTRAVGVHDGPEFFGYLVDGLVPGVPLEAVSDPLQRVLQAVGIVLMRGDVQAFAADIAPAPGIALVALDPDDAVVFHLDLKAAVLGTQYASCPVPLSHVLPPSNIFTRERIFLSGVSFDRDP
jgi:hypothetical protein